MSIETTILELQQQHDNEMIARKLLVAEFEELRKQLAAEQLHSKRLRKLFCKVKELNGYRDGELIAARLLIIEQALAAPSATDALDAYVMEKQMEILKEVRNAVWDCRYSGMSEGVDFMNRNCLFVIDRLAQQLEAGKDGE